MNKTQVGLNEPFTVTFRGFKPGTVMDPDELIYPDGSVARHSARFTINNDPFTITKQFVPEYEGDYPGVFTLRYPIGGKVYDVTIRLVIGAASVPTSSVPPASPAATPAPATVVGSGTSSISGEVLSCVGVGGVTVQLLRDSDHSKVLASTATAADGSYRFSAIPAGTYVIGAVLPSGFQSYGSSRPNATVAAGEEAQWDITLTRRLTLTSPSDWSTQQLPLTVTWQPLEGAASYSIGVWEWRGEGQPFGETGIYSGEMVRTDFVISGLAPGRTYFWKVFAHGGPSCKSSLGNAYRFFKIP